MAEETKGKAKTGRQASKTAQLIRMLSTRAGTDVVRIGKRLGWQHHTTRAAISGLRKAGYKVTSEKPAPDKPTLYRITDAPATATEAGTAPEPADAR